MNDEILHEMIRSSSNAEEVEKCVSRKGLELGGSELSAVTAVVDFRAARVPEEALASRRAAFLGRVAMQRTREIEARPQSNPWIRRMAVAAAGVAALGVAAAGGAKAGGISDTVAEAVGLRDGKNVYTTTSFEPSFKVTLPNENWKVLVDKRDAFIPDGGGDFGHAADAQFGIYKPLGWADPAGEARYIIPGNIIAWLRGHPRLDAGEPTTVTVGGIEGIQIDLDVVCTCDALFEDSNYPEVPGRGVQSVIEQRNEAVRNESVTLFHLEDPFGGVFGVPGDSNPYLDFTLSPGPRYRLILFEVDGEDLVVVSTGVEHRNPIYGGATRFEWFVRPLLDSLVVE
ncbi:MAG TPA: hypothetical protein VGR43_05980 [Dehalococcoidia bacterium]|nr:hypothetical protein [Dehalococcoidia bacterium]